MTEKKVMKLASRGKRFGAACIDSVVPFVSYLLYVAVMSANGIRTGLPGYGYGNDFGYGFGYGYGYGYGYEIGRNHLHGASAVIMAAVFIILLAYIVLEFILFARGKSIGKAMLGLQVVSSRDGKPFRFWKMLFRECLVKSASGSVFCLGYIWILIDEKNRGWHDKILDSYVVDLKESERMNLRRHLDQARKAAMPAEPAPEPEIMEAEPLIRGTQAAAEPVIEVTPEVVTAETVVEAVEEAAETVREIAEKAVTESAETAEEAAAETAEETAAETVEEAAAETVEEAATETAEEAAAGIGKTAAEAAEMPELSMSMKKEELLAAARERGIQVSSRATKAAIIELIQKASEEDPEK